MANFVGLQGSTVPNTLQYDSNAVGSYTANSYPWSGQGFLNRWQSNDGLTTSNRMMQSLDTNSGQTYSCSGHDFVGVQGNTAPNTLQYYSNADGSYNENSGQFYPWSGQGFLNRWQSNDGLTTSNRTMQSLDTNSGKTYSCSGHDFVGVQGNTAPNTLQYDSNADGSYTANSGQFYPWSGQGFLNRWQSNDGLTTSNRTMQSLDTNSGQTHSCSGHDFVGVQGNTAPNTWQYDSNAVQSYNENSCQFYPWSGQGSLNRWQSNDGLTTSNCTMQSFNTNSGHMYSRSAEDFVDVQGSTADNWQYKPNSFQAYNANSGQFYPWSGQAFLGSQGSATVSPSDSSTNSGQKYSSSVHDLVGVQGVDTWQHERNAEQSYNANSGHSGQDLFGVQESAVNERSEETPVLEESEHEHIDVESIDSVNSETTVPILNEPSPIQSTKTHTEPEQLVITLKNDRGCDNSSMFVRTSNEKAKKLCCPFCDKIYSKLARHLEEKHKTEPDVSKFLSYAKGSKKRRGIQDALRKMGTTTWNKNASLNKKEIITSRRPNQKFNRKATDFKTCPYCYGSYARTGLSRHVKYNCPNKPISIDEKAEPQRIITALGTSLEGRIHENASARLQTIFENFRDDDVVRLIRFDWLVILYGNKLSEKYKRLKHGKMIRNYLRLAGRILRALQETKPELTEFQKLYHPKHFDALVEAIRNIARLDNVRNEFEAPATASDAVAVVKVIGQMLITEYIKRDDREGQRITENFLTVMNSDIPILINKTVKETQERMNREKQVTVPATEDIKLLALHVDSERENCFNELSSKFLFDTWKNLAELTMASIIVFNRRRVGDTEDIEVGDFIRREVISERSNEEDFQSLSDQSKQIAAQYSRMKVRGKKNRPVHVLLKPEIEKSIMLLLSHRKEAGVSSDNELLFGLPPKMGKNKVVNGCMTLRKLASACGAKNPNILTGTLLRKQLATACRIMEVDNNQVGEVADFMGHAKNVHLDVYVQNPIERQIVKISEVLEAAQGNVTRPIVGHVERKRKKTASVTLPIASDVVRKRNKPAPKTGPIARDIVRKKTSRGRRD